MRQVAQIGWHIPEFAAGWWVLHIQGRCECDYSDYPHYAPAAQLHCHQEANLHNTIPNTSVCKLGVSAAIAHNYRDGGPMVKH